MSNLPIRTRGGPSRSRPREHDRHLPGKPPIKINRGVKSKSRPMMRRKILVQRPLPEKFIMRSLIKTKLPIELRHNPFLWFLYQNQDKIMYLLYSKTVKPQPLGISGDAKKGDVNLVCPLCKRIELATLINKKKKLSVFNVLSTMACEDCWRKHLKHGIMLIRKPQTGRPRQIPIIIIKGDDLLVNYPEWFQKAKGERFLVLEPKEFKEVLNAKNKVALNTSYLNFMFDYDNFLDAMKDVWPHKGLTLWNTSLYNVIYPEYEKIKMKFKFKEKPTQADKATAAGMLVEVLDEIGFAALKWDSLTNKARMELIQKTVTKIKKYVPPLNLLVDNGKISSSLKEDSAEQAQTA